MNCKRDRSADVPSAVQNYSVLSAKGKEKKKSVIAGFEIQTRNKYSGGDFIELDGGREREGGRKREQRWNCFCRADLSEPWQAG